jgi:outer membrane protein OmpA-like peptidoglycan-associated protein
METPPMPHAHTPRPLPLRRTLTQAFVLSLIPLGTAFAQANQTLPHVRVTRDGTEVRSLRQVDDVRMTPPKGTVLEVIYIEGDRYAHRNSNWYWVLLPPDPWATRPAGWIHGDAIELVPPSVPATTTPLASRTDGPPTGAARIETRSDTRVVDVPVAASAEEVRAAPVIFSDVVLNFQFGRSELTEEAKSKLASAISMPKPNGRMSVALEGYADWVGTETYNEQLGLARAEAVRRYLADQLRIPTSAITVVSYGESNPAAPNTTREGRAQNRRVVIKVGA